MVAEGRYYFAWFQMKYLSRILTVSIASIFDMRQILDCQRIVFYIGYDKFYQLF